MRLALLALATVGAIRDSELDDETWLKESGQRYSHELADCPLSSLLSVAPVRGFHVACAVLDESGDGVSRLCIFADGQDVPACTHALLLEGGETIDAVTMAVVQRVRPGWQRRPRAPQPAMFSASGRLLPRTWALSDVGVPKYRRVVVVIEGGSWHWPPIRVGFERPLGGLARTTAGQITLRTLSLRPRVFEVKSFIEEDECDRILEVAGPRVRKSDVVVKDQDHGKDVDEWRSSFTYFLSSRGDPILEALDERVQNATRLPITHSEDSQILKYEHNGRYVAHTDYFDPEHYRKDARTLELTANGVHNRLLTVFMYMSNVEKGGETNFPAHNGLQPTDFADCTKGLSVAPERRKVVIFYNMHPSGDLDGESLHAGCRVLNGTKWSANFWVWNVPKTFKQEAVHIDMAEKLLEWEEERDREEEAAMVRLETAAVEGAAEDRGEL